MIWLLAFLTPQTWAGLCVSIAASQVAILYMIWFYKETNQKKKKNMQQMCLKLAEGLIVTWFAGGMQHRKRKEKVKETANPGR